MYRNNAGLGGDRVRRPRRHLQFWQGLRLEQEAFTRAHDEMSAQVIVPRCPSDCSQPRRVVRAVSEDNKKGHADCACPRILRQTSLHLRDVMMAKAYVARSSTAFFSTGGQGLHPFVTFKHFVAAVEPLVMLGEARASALNNQGYCTSFLRASQRSLQDFTMSSIDRGKSGPSRRRTLRRSSGYRSCRKCSLESGSATRCAGVLFHLFCSQKRLRHRVDR